MTSISGWLALALVGCAAPVAHPAIVARAADPAPPVAAAPDLLRCPLTARAYELGGASSTAPSAPVRAGDGFVVAFTDFVGPHYRLVTQRVDATGVLGAVNALDEVPGPCVPVLAARGDELELVTNDGNQPRITRLAPATGAPAQAARALPAWPDDLAIGPRGFVATSETEGRRTIQRAGQPDVGVPALDGGSIPHEQIVASGAGVEVVLARRDLGTDHVVTAVVLTPGAAVPELVELFRTHGDEWGEASIAAGADGFLIVRDGPALDELQLIRLDARGARRGEAIVVKPALDVSRYPRAVALATGWIVSYWDGTGSVIQRVGADGALIGDPIGIRSGDERGGHTEARMAVSGDAIAISWQVSAPMMNHGMADEQPRRPGPRIAILRCTP